MRMKRDRYTRTSDWGHGLGHESLPRLPEVTRLVDENLFRGSMPRLPGRVSQNLPCDDLKWFLYLVEEVDWSFELSSVGSVPLPLSWGLSVFSFSFFRWFVWDVLSKENLEFRGGRKGQL